MGIESTINRSNGSIIDQDWFNLFNRILQGDFTGRDNTGAATPGQRLGTPIIPWGTLYADGLIIDGQPLDPGALALDLNRVASGAVRSSSDFPDYLRPAGPAGGAQFTMLATAVNLKIFVNGVEANFTADTDKTGLTVAPSSNNTCQINDVGLIGQDMSKNLGENGTVIPVDTMGSELTGKIGEFVALLNQTTSEIMYCRVDSAVQLSVAKRGFFFDSSGNPVERSVLNNNDILQILSLCFIFAENDGATIDVTYRNPVIGAVEPASPQSGDYWLDTEISAWKRYSGTAFDQIDRTFIGYAVIDTADCIGTRPEDFGKSYRERNSLEITLESVNVAIAETDEFLISLNGKEKRFDFSFLRWDAATDFESGVTRTADRYYWLYVTEDGAPKISDKKPYERLGFLRGWYHPYQSWRAVGQLYNNSSNEFELVSKTDKPLIYLEGKRELPDICLISNNITDPANDIDFAQSRFVSDDLLIEAETPAYTKQLDALWSPGNNVGMWDTGTVPVTGAIFLYKIHNLKDKLTDYIATATFGSPSLPADYTLKEYCGFVPRIGGANLAWRQYDKTFYLDAVFNIYSGFPPTLVVFNIITIAPPGVPSLSIINASGGTGLTGALGVFKIGTPAPYPPTVVFYSGGANTLNVETTLSGGFAQIAAYAALGGTGTIDLDALGWVDYGIRG